MRRTRIRSLALFMMVCLGLIGNIIMIPTPAAAAPCHKEECNDQDPKPCAYDARTLDMHYIYNTYGSTVGMVELRASEDCGTNWSRVTAFGNNNTTWRAMISASGHTYEETGHAVQSWTNMVYAPTAPAIACGDIWWTNRVDSGVASECIYQ